MFKALRNLVTCEVIRYKHVNSVNINTFMNMVKINTELHSSPTKLSAFIRFLVKICFLPITIEEEERKISFRWKSRKTCTYLVAYVLSYILFTMLIATILMNEEVLKKFSEKNIVENLSVFAGSSGGSGLIFPVILARGLDDISLKSVWDKNLSFPKHGVQTIISYFGMIIGSCVGYVGYILQFDLEMDYIAKAFFSALSSTIMSFSNILFPLKDIFLEIIIFS